ncbi:putative N-formylglutamate amidohydrolase [Pararhizobium capsulatum DSM 1112]|uniref:N-formylglutamate amidohydrolase n=1 Tax=Pararhizobium capsulatum DSM 1112 TaxID=1121113 RepID=A0ABU0BXF4_9HYPH|nr:N-formylglutamate amidohydrolase [Pararhizobium capsulatum]MDQ0322953.1 putative N-formylglutamate amidohydrolase [Pararhizobium capsulatum DSM 1112]
MSDCELKSTSDWPPAIEVLNEHGASDIVLICEHASNYIPASFDRLGLSPSELDRHIAWDLGASEVARGLSKRLNAICFLGTYSRLLIDLNRPLNSPTSIPQRSEDTEIPGNIAITDADRSTRIARIFEPFQARIAAHLDARAESMRSTMLVAIHSFTPVFLGGGRPWHAGILFERSKDLGAHMITDLALDPELIVGANVPYVIDRMEDYAIPVHGDERGHPAVLVEIRQDLIASEAGIAIWVEKLVSALADPPEASFNCRPGSIHHVT